jgi:peptide deformylase
MSKISVGIMHAACSLKYETPLKVLLYPDPRLRAKNKRITTFDENLENFAREMFRVMYR